MILSIYTQIFMKQTFGEREKRERERKKASEV
jgi:hypothetical protein